MAAVAPSTRFRRSSIPAHWLRAMAVWLATCCAALAVPFEAAQPEADTQGTVDEKADAKAKAEEAAALFAKIKRLRAEKDWEGVAAGYSRMLELQPKQRELRQIVAWDLSYNISTEQDDVAARYQWVKRGILVLLDGIDLDRTNARVCWEAGWFIAQKIGRADERREYRRLFAADSAFHERIAKYVAIKQAAGPDGKPDNWLVGLLFFRLAIERGGPGESTIEGMSNLTVYADPPMCRIDYARALSEEGHSRRVVADAWREAEKEWREYGDREIPTTYGFSIRLAAAESLAEEASRLWKEFDKLQPGLRDRLHDEALKSLSDAQRRALETPFAQRTDEQRELAADARFRLELSAEKLAASITGANRAETLRLGKKALEVARQADITQRYQLIVNFDYWLRRCRIEQSDPVIDARQLLSRAESQLDKGLLADKDPDHPGARRLYERAFRKWSEIFALHKDLIDDEEVCGDLVEAIARYQRVVLEGRSLPEDFPLREVVNRWGSKEPSP